MRWFAPVFGLLVLPAFSWQYQYLYDIPVLCLSAACFYCLASEKFRAYLFFFVLACLNKETSVFILLFFAFWFYGRLDRPRYMTLLAAQGLIYICIKLILTYSYFDNPGWVLEQNVGWVMTHDLFSRSKFDRILTVALIFFLLTFRWSEKPLFLKTVFWVAPFFYAAYLFFGVPGEYRVFFDIMPLLILLAAHTLIEGTGVGGSPIFVPPKERSS